VVAIGIAVFAGIAAAGLAGDGLQTGPFFFAVTTNPFVDALFGAPIAHEDHAQRACYAALLLRDTVREYANEVRVRHGTHLGAHRPWRA
jgi:class 3 adenylate cyclase